MKQREHARKIFRISLSLAIVTATLLSILPIDFFVLKEVRHYTVHLMLGFFIMGFISLLFQEKRLLYVSFICCGIIGAFLQESFDEQLFRSFYPEETEEAYFKVAHFNVSSSQGDYYSTVEAILKCDADIVSVQEVTPDWNLILDRELRVSYPYSKSVVRIDFHGMALYSKFPFEQIDTFEYKGIPNIIGSVKIDSNYQEIYFVGSHTKPPLNFSAYVDLEGHLDRISSVANSVKSPLISFGDYNVVPWSDEIKAFRNKSGLISARRDFTPTFAAQSELFFKSPIDHIFYSEDLKCLEFSPVEGTSSNHLGILSRFQFKNKSTYVKGSIE